MPWPSKITGAFATVEGVYANEYCGPYNKLLHTLFPVDSDFIVEPDYTTSAIFGDAEFIISFKIYFRQCPVLILELKPPQHLSQYSGCKSADRQLRECLGNLLEYAPFPILYGISAIGTRRRFYECEGEDACITPESIIRGELQEQWDCDVLEADGEQQLRELAAHITNLCEQLGA